VTDGRWWRPSPITGDPGAPDRGRRRRVGAPAPAVVGVDETGKVGGFVGWTLDDGLVAGAVVCGVAMRDKALRFPTICSSMTAIEPKDLTLAPPALTGRAARAPAEQWTGTERDAQVEITKPRQTIKVAFTVPARTKTVFVSDGEVCRRKVAAPAGPVTISFRLLAEKGLRTLLGPPRSRYHHRPSVKTERFDWARWCCAVIRPTLLSHTHLALSARRTRQSAPGPRLPGSSRSLCMRTRLGSNP